MTFSWDSSKNDLNIKNHGISFEVAIHIFEDNHRIEIYDYEHSINEDRYVTIGMVKDILFVVYTMRGETTRLISARKATNQERRIYYGRDYS